MNKRSMIIFLLFVGLLTQSIHASFIPYRKLTVFPLNSSNSYTPQPFSPSEALRFSVSDLPSKLVVEVRGNYQVLGGSKGYIIYDGAAGYLKSPGLPPSPLMLVVIDGVVDNVELTFYYAEKVPIDPIFLPNPVPYEVFFDYSAVNFSQYPVPLRGVWPDLQSLRVIHSSGKTLVYVPLAIYNLESKYALVLTRFGLYYSAGSVRSTSDFLYDAIVITPTKYLDYALNYSYIHSDKALWIVTTDWIYSNFPEAEPPSFPGFKDEHPGWNTLAKYYNFSLALRIISFLRESRGIARSVVLFGDAISVPPSYYYWDENYYVSSKNYFQSWIPTDVFYASPDYDFDFEFSVGRIPAVDPRDFSIYLEKLSYWINATSSGADWTKNAFLVGGMPFGTLYYSGEATLMDIVNRGYLLGFRIRKFFETRGNYNDSIVKELYSGAYGGSLFLLQFSHGSETALYKLDKYSFRWIKLIDSSYLLGLNWSWRYPIVVAPACSSGYYDYGIFDGSLRYSFGQSVIFSRAGGIAYIGMSRIAYGALTFYFDKGLLKSPFLLYAQAFLEALFRAYSEGAPNLGGIFARALELFSIENDMEYWINLRTLFEATLIGDPLLELPQFNVTNTSFGVEVDSSTRTIPIPLLYGEASYYDYSRPVNIEVHNATQYVLWVFSPQNPLSYRYPYLNLSLSSDSISVLPPSTGVNVVDIEDLYGREYRVYIRGLSVRLENIRIDYVDSDNNGYVESIVLNLDVYFGAPSITSLVWGYRCWVKGGGLSDSSERFSINYNVKAEKVGNTTISVVLDAGYFKDDPRGMGFIDVMFFSWWPWLMTWWMSGPNIWIDFSFRLLLDLRSVSMEPLVKIDLTRSLMVDLDGDSNFEGVDLEFDLDLGGSYDGYVLLEFGFLLKLESPSGGRYYYYSYPYPIKRVASSDRTSIHLLWGLSAWYARGSWGSLDWSQIDITYYYSLRVKLVTSSGVSILRTVGYVEIPSLHNVVPDFQVNVEGLYIPRIYALPVASDTGDLVGVILGFDAYALRPGFYRTEFILEKRSGDSWVILYQKELTAGIFKFFWSRMNTQFLVGFVPSEFLGNGTFRFTVQAFDYVSGQKIILVSNSTVFNYSGRRSLLSHEIKLLDQDGDSIFGHVFVELNSSRSFDYLSVKVNIYQGYSSLYGFSDVRYLTSSYVATQGLSISKRLTSGNFTLETQIAFGILGQLVDFPFVVENSINATIEDRAFDSYYSYYPTAIISGLRKILNTISVAIRIYLSFEYSLGVYPKLLLDNEEILTLDNKSTVINLNNLSEGEHWITLVWPWWNTTIRFIVDLTPPEICVPNVEVIRSLDLSVAFYDISGIRSAIALINGTTYNITDNSLTADLPEGLWNITITATDLAGWTSKKTIFVSIDKTPPKIISTNFSVENNMTLLTVIAYDPHLDPHANLILEDGTIISIRLNRTIAVESMFSHALIIVRDRAGNSIAVSITMRTASSSQPTKHVAIPLATPPHSLFLLLIAMLVPPLVAIEKQSFIAKDSRDM